MLLGGLMKKMIGVFVLATVGILVFAQQQPATLSMISINNLSTTQVTVALLESDAEIIIVIKNVEPDTKSVMQFVGLVKPEDFMVYVGAYSQVLTPESKCRLEPGHKYSLELKGVGIPAQLVDLGKISS
jgi:hypothetical protein